MLVLRGLHSPDSTPVALTIGNFDGVHLGHQALLGELRRVVQDKKLATAVVIFEPHPREFFTPQIAPTRLTNLREKLERFAELGVDRVYVCRFDTRFAQMSAAQFIAALHEKLHAQHVLIGDDFRFGSGRSGDFALMEKLAAERGFSVQAMRSVLHGGLRVSSTAIRAALAVGDLHSAARYLGRPYSISGRVMHGAKLGRELGFPTANVQLKHNRPPLTGIFAVRVEVDGMDALRGACSLGFRPTVEAHGQAVLEVHLLDFAQQIYGKHLRVAFMHKLRDEEKYPDLASLTQQIALDVAHTKDWFEQHD